MGTHFHQLGIQTFNARIPGLPPTASDRANFVEPIIENKTMSERAIGIELAKTIKSVLLAAGQGGLRVLHTPYHKGKGDHDKRSDTVNDIGIYLDTDAARRLTTLTPHDAKKSKLTEGELESGDFGRRSWYCMAALGEVKSFSNKECAFYMQPKSSSSSSGVPPGSESTAEVEDGFSEEPHLLSTIDASHDGIGDSVDVFDHEPDPLSPSVDDPDGEPYIRKPWDAEFGLGQLGDYMHNLSTYQHRLFSYGFYVRWRWARLLYFDRTGALVSEPFDWIETSSPLHDFVWKFAHMTPEQRGYDPTAQEASYAEIAQVIRKANDTSIPKAIQPYVKATFLSKDKERDHSKKDGLEWDPDECPIYKLTVTSSDPSPDEVFPDSEPPPPSPDGPVTSERTFLVGRPHFVADSLIGRCTRGYIAFAIATEQFCFLKDSWRPRVPGRTRPEHLVYERLRSRGVTRRIATLVCGGDVGGPRRQLTVTHDYFPETKRPTPRIHYRIVTKEIGLPLTEFANFGELNAVFLDAIIAHYTAWTQAGILHRDVSVGNILIDPVTKRGFLIDWDLSRLRSELEEGPVEPDRTGTWQFRSALSLAFPRKPYQVSDDIESFVHSYRWIVLRFHGTSVAGLRTFVQTEYEHSTKTSIAGVRVGGQQKLITFSARKSTFRVRNNDRLQSLLDDLAEGCFTHYEKIDMARMETLYGIPDATSQQPSQPEPTPAEDSEPDSFDDFDDIVRAMTRVQPAATLDEHGDAVPPLQQATQPPTDPCDIVGFLSVHASLVDVFQKWRSNAAPREEDQFRLRFSQDPVDIVLNVHARGISSLSRSKTVDTPTSSSSAQTRKRRQDDDARGDRAAPRAEGNSASPSASGPTRAQVPKRQKKTKTQ